MKFDIVSSAWGRARALLESVPALHARIELDSGESRIVRIVPGMLRAGIVVDPYLESPTDWARWYTGSALHRATRVRIEKPPSPSMYRDRIRVEVLRADDLAPVARPELAPEAMFSWFKTAPTDGVASAPVASTILRGQEVMLVRAPSELRFDVRAGAHTLSGRYGILPSDWGAGHTGGADFSAVLRAPGHEDVVVFHVHVDPTRREIDQRLKYLKATFDSPAAASLLLRTEPGAGGEPPCVDTVWSAIQID